jgi:Na+/H+ antiporter NhaD/arsenite permease-like protein
MRTLAVLIFLMSYALIASRKLRLLPLGRPAGALLGATLMVVAGVLTPRESYHAIDGDTLLLLFATMLIAVYLERSGAFAALAGLLRRAGRTPLGLLFVLVAISGGLSACLVNDTVCVMLTPLVVAVCLRFELPLGPYLMALATSANIGSAATLVGNPQNMIIGSMSGMGFTPFLLRAGPAALVGLGLNATLLWLYYRKRLPATFPAERGGPPEAVPRLGSPLPAVVACGVAVGFLLGLHLGFTALAGAMLLMLAERREPREVFQRVEWSLLVFFIGLFVVVAGLAKTGLVDEAWRWAAPYFQLREAGGLAGFTAFMTAGSNLVSNVPMVLLTGPALPSLGSPERGWVLLAFVTTVAGNLTLLGSVANLIVAEQAKAHYTLGFWEYLKFGLVSTAVVLAAGVPLIVWLT